MRLKWLNISPPGTYSKIMYKFELSCKCHKIWGNICKYIFLTILCGISRIIFGSQVIQYSSILRNCAEQILLVLLSYCYIEMGSKYFLKIYREAILLRLYIWKQISNSKIKALFSNVNIPHKRISIKIFLPWSDTPNWQGMGRKWLVECVFRSMCAQLALIWQPKNTKIF